jgi:fibronectin-binding autotransporter adhesin
MADFFEWTGGAGTGAFQDAGNWVDGTSGGTSGPPGTADTAYIRAHGTITGQGNVSELDLIADGGPLDIDRAAISSAVFQLTGTLAFTHGAVLQPSRELNQYGTSTATLSGDSQIYVAGTDAGGNPVSNAVTIGASSGDQANFVVTGLGTGLTEYYSQTLIGGAGSGSVTVSAGGFLGVYADQDSSSDTGMLTLGGSAGGVGSLLVTGRYSLARVDHDIIIGGSGTGHMTVSAGAEVSFGRYLDVAEGSGGAGTLVVTGTGSRLAGESSSMVDIGQHGTGSMTVAAGGYADLQLLYVGTGGLDTTSGRGTGSVVVTGVGSELVVRSGLYDGQGGTGTVQVLAGARMTDLSTDYLGFLSGDTGKLIVSGAGSTFTQPAGLADGGEGTGNITVGAGGTLIVGASTDADIAIDVALISGSVGTIAVAGSGATLAATGEIDVGEGGTGTLTVGAGGTVSTGNDDGMAGLVVGQSSGASGTVTVSGAGANLTNSGRFVVGDAGSGKLTVSAGGVVRTTLPSNSPLAGAILGNASGGNGAATVSGTGSLWSIGNSLIVGDAGTGSLIIGAGGKVTGATLVMGLNKTGTISVSGAGAQLAISGQAKIGELATSTLSVGGGSTVSIGGTAEVDYGRIALAGGKVTVGGTLTVASGQVISGSGTVQDGGLINNGTVLANGGQLSFLGGVTGSGHFAIGANSTLSLGGSVAGSNVFFNDATGTLDLGAPASFSSVIGGFVAGDTIDLAGVSASSLSYAGQTLTVHETGDGSLALRFAGSFTSGSFAAPTSDGSGGTLIRHA